MQPEEGSRRAEARRMPDQVLQEEEGDDQHLFAGVQQSSDAGPGLDRARARIRARIQLWNCRCQTFGGGIRGVNHLASLCTVRARGTVNSVVYSTIHGLYAIKE